MKMLLFLTLATVFLVGCDKDYISKKREGLKKFPAEDQTREAQEEKK